MQRREFLKSASAASLLAGGLATTASAAHHGDPAKPFTMKFGPHDGHFRETVGKNVLDQIRYAHEQGFTAWEDNRAPRRPEAEQKAIGDLLSDLGMTMGVFVAYADFRHPTFAGHKLDRDDRARKPDEVRAMLEGRMHQAVEVAKRTGAKWMTVVPGTFDVSLLEEYQTQNVVELLKRCADILEPHGLVAVLEPLNPINHPGCFLTRVAQANQICKMVDSPSVKILNDLYHQQITEGRLITNMIDAWDEIAYIQVGDVPGRKEPTTGEINYRHIFQWLHDRGYDGVVGMEHGKSMGGKEGEARLIAAYREVDAT